MGLLKCAIETQQEYYFAQLNWWKQEKRTRNFFNLFLLFNNIFLNAYNNFHRNTRTSRGSNPKWGIHTRQTWWL